MTRPFCFRSPEQKEKAAEAEVERSAKSDHILDCLHFATQAVVRDIWERWGDAIKWDPIEGKDDDILREYHAFYGEKNQTNTNYDAAMALRGNEIKMMERHVDEIFTEWVKGSVLIGTGKITSVDWQSRMATLAKQFRAKEFMSKIVLFGPPRSITSFMACYAYKKVYRESRKLRSEFPFRMALGELCAIKAESRGSSITGLAHYVDRAFQHKRLTEPEPLNV